MLTVTSYIGRRQGPRFVAFYGCMFYAMMRPSEVIVLTKDGGHPPEDGWGRLIFAEASPAAGKDFTDDGRVHEDRGLKGRARRASARQGTRNVPIPAELVSLLRAHIERPREDGADWRQIGQALRLRRAAEEHDGDLGAKASEYAAGPPAQRFDRLWFGWRCPACGNPVIDYGPHGGHPDDCETGHADSCQRRAAAVAAYEARWDDED